MNHNQWRFYRNKLSEIYKERDFYYPPESTSNNPIPRTFECWHYTSMKSLTSIFKEYIDSNDNEINSINLYASNIRFMNDSQEYKDGETLFLDYVSKTDLEDQYKKLGYDADAYVISFCESGDVLSQWRGYGKESGISFCFLEENAVYKTYTETNEKGEDKTRFVDSYTKPLPVIYNNGKKLEYFEKLLTLLAPQEDGFPISHFDLLQPLFIPYCKNEFFYEEREQRLVFYTTDGIKPQSGNKITFNYVYNTFGAYVKPALNVKIKRKSTILSKNFSNSSGNNGPLITKMIVGPGSNQEIVFNTLIHIFDRVNRDNFMYFDESKEKSKKKKTNAKPLLEKDLKSDRKIHYIQCTDGHDRFAYRCSNDLIIMKSAIPFRS